MNKFEKKYGIKEDEKVKAYHRSRIMFCIYQNRLYVADRNLPYSHLVWFEKEGWMSPDNDDFINKIVRGIVDDIGDIYFYIGYDFRINNDVEKIFLAHLSTLVDKLKLNPNARIFGGAIKSEQGKKWPPIRKYGKIKDNLK